MSFLTYLKIGAAVILLGIAGYFYWNYQHMQTVIAAQKIEIAGLQEGQRILKSEMEKVSIFMEAAGKARRKVRNVENKVDTIPDTAGDALVLELLAPYRVQSKGNLPSPGPRPGGGAGPPPRPKAPIYPNR